MNVRSATVLAQLVARITKTAAVKRAQAESIDEGPNVPGSLAIGGAAGYGLANIANKIAPTAQQWMPAGVRYGKNVVQNGGNKVKSWGAPAAKAVAPAPQAGVPAQAMKAVAPAAEAVAPAAETAGLGGRVMGGLRAAGRTRTGAGLGGLQAVTNLADSAGTMFTDPRTGEMNGHVLSNAAGNTAQDANTLNQQGFGGRALSGFIHPMKALGALSSAAGDWSDRSPAKLNPSGMATDPAAPLRDARIARDQQRLLGGTLPPSPAQQITAPNLPKAPTPLPEPHVTPQQSQGPLASKVPAGAPPVPSATTMVNPQPKADGTPAGNSTAPRGSGIFLQGNEQGLRGKGVGDTSKVTPMTPQTQPKGSYGGTYNPSISNENKAGPMGFKVMTPNGNGGYMEDKRIPVNGQRMGPQPGVPSSPVAPAVPAKAVAPGKPFQASPGVASSSLDAFNTRTPDSTAQVGQWKADQQKRIDLGKAHAETGDAAANYQRAQQNRQQVYDRQTPGTPTALTNTPNTPSMGLPPLSKGTMADMASVTPKPVQPKPITPAPATAPAYKPVQTMNYAGPNKSPAFTPPASTMAGAVANGSARPYTGGDIKPPSSVGAPKPAVAMQGQGTTPAPTVAASPIKPIAPIKTGSVKRAQANKPSGAEQRPTKDEYERRKDRVRKVVGLIMGMGYGGFAGTVLGKEVFHAPVPRSAAIGATVGGLAGLGVGTAMGHMNRYTGGHEHPAPINIIIPASNPQMMHRVEDALQAKTATARTLKHFVKQADRRAVLEKIKDELTSLVHRNRTEHRDGVQPLIPPSPPSIESGGSVKASRARR